MMGPSNPPVSRFRMTALPTRPGRLLAPTTATERGRNIRSSVPLLIQTSRAGRARPSAVRPPDPGASIRGAPPPGRTWRRAPSRRERLDARLRPPEDQGVDVVRALVGVDGLEVHDVADE